MLEEFDVSVVCFVEPTQHDVGPAFLDLYELGLELPRAFSLLERALILAGVEDQVVCPNRTQALGEGAPAPCGSTRS